MQSFNESQEVGLRRPPRGFYSEALTLKFGFNEAVKVQEPPKKVSLIWQLRTEKFAPIIPRLIPPLQRKFLAPEQIVVSFDLEDRKIEFPVQAYHPKVQVEYQVSPGCLPRRVQVERKRREFLAQDITKLLTELGVDPCTLIPPDDDDLDKYNLATSQHFLPLQIFDNQEFDCRLEEEWLNLGEVQGVRFPVPAEAFIPVKSRSGVSYGWSTVAVQSYDKGTREYTVLPLDDSDTTRQLPRIYVMFKAEDPRNFAARIKDALDRRREAENLIRYETIVDCLMFPGIIGNSDAILKRIFNMATRLKAYKSRDFILSLGREVKNNFKRSMCELSFIRTVARFPEVFSFIRMPVKVERAIPENGCLPTQMNDFQGTRAQLRWLNLFVIPESYQAMCHVVNECRKVTAMSLFNFSFGKNINLDEFLSVQTQATNATMKFLRSPWLQIITQGMRMCLRDVGKGWFNINVKKWEIYNISKLQRLMELVKYHMQGALRALVTSSASIYTNLIESLCLCCQELKPDFVWGADLVTSSFIPTGLPIFNVQLKMDPDKVWYSTDPLNFEPELVGLFNFTIAQTHTVQQVHPFILEHLTFAEDLFLSSVGLEEMFVCDMRKRFVDGIRQAIIPLRAYAQEYYRHIELWELNVQEYVNKFKDEDHTAVELKEEVQFQLKMKVNLEVTLPEKIVIGPFIINVDPLKQFLVGKRKDMYIKLLDMFAERQKEKVEEVLNEYQIIMRKLNEKPVSIENIFEIKEWIETIPMTVSTQNEIMRTLALEYDILDQFWYALNQEDFDAKWEGLFYPLKIQAQIEATFLSLEEETEKFEKLQLGDESTLLEKIDHLTVMVTRMANERDIEKVHELGVDCRRIWKNMKECQDQGLLLNQRQKLFGVPVTPFENLTKLMKEFEPYRNLWITSSDWLRWSDMWMDNPLTNVDGDSIEKNVTESLRTIVKSIRIFTDIPGVQKIAKEIKEQIDDFRPHVSLIQALRDRGLRPRHWEEISYKTGIQISMAANLTFRKCLEAGLGEYADVVVQVAESAGKEFALEQALNKMQTEWESIVIELTAYKDTGTFIMKISDEVTQMLDDHLILTQQMSFSPFKGEFEENLSEWEDKLHLTQFVLEEWTECQKQWMYLEPIFTSEDINRQLPSESKKYNTMERNWRRIMKNAVDQPTLIVVCPDKKLLESLKECNHLLEQVQKGLSDYLEIKRIVFPRFYFLSDEELLEILSQGKNPTAVQPHLRKCFENIAKLHFEEDLEITAMYSGEGECVKFDPSMYPTGNVENWLLQVEENMRNTLRSTLGKSLEDLKTKERKDWVLKWPGQLVIAGSQTEWTAQVEQGILEEKLPEYYNTMLEQLDDLRGLVKGPLERVERQVLSALIVIEVHARDVLANLLKENVKNINDFEWISQLRYYWVEEELKVRAVNAEFQYGYEYLGNSGRLVITPLTDRCYLTLTGALHLKFGGAPAGPAGTGKTETTKDLAKAFAIQCVVFNCSDQLDFMAMGKFFKGLASSGAWACFDEFNRIDIEVLSVVAQQITTIQKAQQARMDRFLFEGVEIALKVSCAVFITMNPGYAGRTELPDNLKALFRPVAMMVPNYTLIAEISLFSFGFSDARDLAGKITTTFKLSSEQLSSQDHYDFGMRAVKTVIAVAGNLKREHPAMDERQIVLRALRDVNVPKFLRDDLKLFNGIVSDLFPRMIEQQVDYGILEQSIKETCLIFKLEDVSEFVRKVIQLYETTVVRHGLMLVGPTGSGKTKCYEILQAALTKLKGKPSPAGTPFETVHTYVLNPKSITMGQLYGEFDLLTHEWTDGILSSLVRLGSSTTDQDKRWYVLDGPVDAVWIENLNTVLDDNKKLCLSSGEIIKLHDNQTMMFEVADLAVASPATVSRCGMVYLEPGVLGLQPFVNCWINRLPLLAKPFEEQLRILVDRYVLPSIILVRDKLEEVVTSTDSALLVSFLNLMDTRLLPLTHPGGKPHPAPQFLKLIPGLLVPWVTTSVIWSAGATCHLDSRHVFSDWMRDRMKHAGDGPVFPEQGLVYDYRLHDGGFTDPTPDNEPRVPVWMYWMDGLEEYDIFPDTKYSDIEVPTIDTVRSSFILGKLLDLDHPVLCVGNTGTCKTVTVVSKLSRGLNKNFLCEFMAFSARTSANQTQDLIDSKLDRRRKGVFGPPLLKKLVFFIDDLNMPALEIYGAQPPIELIRQWMDFKGWYDRRNIGEFHSIVDVIFVGAMGPPGGGRNPVTLRLLRHFHYLAFTEQETESKVRIFGTILRSWLRRSQGLLPLWEQVVTSTLSVYDTIRQELLPTPAKTHYTFNLRDLSKVFQGMLMFNPEPLQEIDPLVRLWYHECCRVFQDRLVNDEDREWFDQLLREKIGGFGINADKVLEDRVILFGDFLEPQSDVKNYEEIMDMEKLSKVLDQYLEDYNHHSTAPMKLVLFLDAISHVCRISRIIRQPLGNALLLGMGGSGRRSLTRLAAHMGDLTCFQIELSKAYGPVEWRDDIKNLMLKAGLENKETVFLFSDTQIKKESFLEDLNSVLNSGDVPNIYQPDELDKIYQAMRVPVTEQGLPTTRPNLFAAYQKIVRSNLHTVITMSPIGEVFRARLRQFPALVNCCTIDWFSAWPDSALQNVALQFLDDMPDLDVSQEVLKGIVVTCQFMHQSVVDASELYLQELSRHNYVTATSYLELLNSYSNILARKKGELLLRVHRLNTGLDKLQSTGEEVQQLQKELTAMKPDLELAAQEAAKMITRIDKDKVVAEETKIVVEKEEAEATKQAETTQAIAADAQKDLDEAMPMLLAAETSLRALNKGDITEVRALKRPPLGVHLVMEAICIVKDVKPLKVAGSKPGEKINDYWEPGRALLQNPDHFLSSLMNFDKEAITEAIILKLKPYIENPNFEPSKIITVSKACTSLCMWVHAMYKYYFVNKSVAPKKATLATAKEELAITEKALAEAKARMKEVMDGLAVLEKKLQDTMNHKAKLEANMKLCEDRMGRAVRLVSGLADEKERWKSTVASLGFTISNVIGDVLISAGAVAYLTPFTDKYRRGLLKEWLVILGEVGVPHTVKCTPVSTLGEPVTIRKWQLDGLPRDFLSTENAVLVFNSTRWPLFIDPQRQANRWIRNMGKASGLAIAKLTDRDLLRSLESAVRFGKQCLIENVGTELDPALDSVLQRQVFRQAGTNVIKIGDSIVPYNEDFRLFITTKLPNPHYTPEVSIKVMVVNFSLVPSGLQDQLLALVVMEERPDLEEARGALIVSSAQMRHELKEIEDRILYRLSVSEGSPVDDIDLINTLEASKVKSEEIKIKVEDAEKTQLDIDSTRALYIPVANRAQILFFCLSDLANIDPMYQYSLEWFVAIFINSIITTEKSGDIDSRVLSINNHFTFSLFSNVCRSLFEKHKLHFAFLLCVRILMDEGRIDSHEYHVFLAGGAPPQEKPKPDVLWLSARAWKEIQILEILPVFKEWAEAFPEQINQYQQLFDSLEPHKEALPSPWDERFSDFQHMIILKCLRPDKLTNAMQDFITKHLGQRFIEPQTTDLSAIFQDSSPTTPLIFVLSTGTDPAADLYKFADKMRFNKKMLVISLGQGQGPRAEAMLRSAMEAGFWVFFQNCHLSPSWMPSLEHLLENISLDTTHKDFRTWLTSTPSPHFPVAILQNGSKMTVEPPKGIKANMMRAYMSQVPEFHEFLNSENPKVGNFKLLLFSLCLFHGVCLERRKFGPLGFNIPYEFTDGDLRICVSQLHMFLMEYADIPFKVLVYTAGHINYGGRVTDDWDRRCIMNLLEDYYSLEVIHEHHNFDEDGIYHQLPVTTPLPDYLTYIRTMPLNDTPSIFGLHPNADISYAQSETFNCLATLLALQPRVVSGEAHSKEDVTAQVAANIDETVPDIFDEEVISFKYPVLYEESLNTVLVQEVIRYNKLLSVIHSSIGEMLRALKGLVVMSQALEEMSHSIFTNAVPNMWANRAYPSLKPLGAWVKDLQQRIEFLKGWIDDGIPPLFWISGFYFPQAFLTGTMQNFARKCVISIDSIDFNFKVLEQIPTTRPEDGCYIYGLFLEGARWDENIHMLAESRKKELYTALPVVWLIPKENRKLPESGMYQCPVYKTLTRAGTLSTTGHSTNYVVTIEIPSDRPQKHWIKRGVALFCALDF